MIKQFISASTPFTILPLYYFVHNSKSRNYSFYSYAMIAPIWLGAWNMIIYQFVKNKLHRLFVNTIISFSLSVFFAHYLNSYDFTQEEWHKYYIILFFIHFILWFITIYLVENLIS